MGWLSNLSLLCVVFFILRSQVCYSSLSSPSSSTSFTRPQCHLDEGYALLLFKSSFSVSPKAILDRTTSWKNNTNCCTWSGIVCDEATGHVIGLDLSFNRLEGTISSNSSLFSLRYLQRLDLSGNDFEGSPIPPEFGQFKNMTHLDLSFSVFSGQIPSTIAHLSKLVSLLYALDGPPKITIEAATFEALSQNLTKLSELALVGIDMSSLTSASLMNLSSSLTSLDLGFSRLHGKLPENVFRLPKLRVLNIFGNEALFGFFPKSNWSTPVMELDLSSTGISIDLPHLLKHARHLSTLSLSGCKFVGSYPAFLHNLSASQITSLDLSANHFSGQIPWSSLNLSQLQSLDLSYNNFTGQLPEVSGESTQNFSSNDPSKFSLAIFPSSLTFLSLSSNLLNGTIPSWIFALPYLVELDLSDNLFTGEIGEFQSTFLNRLALGRNNLHGHIPVSIFENIFLSSLDLSSNNFTGDLELEKLSKLNELFLLDVSSNNLSLKINSTIKYSFDNLISLGLSSCNISEFPSFLRSSKKLAFLDLSRNHLHGNVPRWLWEVGKDLFTDLNLSYNFLTYIEPLPWTYLETLDLRSNMFSGPLPNILSPSLWFFSVSKNQFTGKMPTSICSLMSLQVLDFSNNDLTGSIPQCIGKIRSLSVLDLRGNKLYGTIPTAFAEENSLRSLNLNGNQLEGSLPRSLVHCRHLEVLDLGNNLLSDTFPNWLESLPELRVLVLRGNKLRGSIGRPKNKSPFRSLRIIDLSHNDFNGALPIKYFENLKAMMNAESGKVKYMGNSYYHDSVMVVMKGLQLELVKIQTIFTTIDFSSNKFTGGIPELIGRLKSLKGLNFSHNQLSGIIPTSLGDLSNLEWLDLCSNELTGKIPAQLADVTSLAFLNLSWNRLEGLIPSGNQFNTFTVDSYIGNPGLCGFPLSKPCSNIDEAQQDQHDDEEHDDGMLDWKVVIMGYGSGMVIGISVGYMVLSRRSFDNWLMEKLGRKPRHISIAPLSNRR